MLIGLNGRKQAGKDTVYERTRHIMRDVMPVERASFADLLYRSAAAALGVTVEQLQMWKADPNVRVAVGKRYESIGLVPESEITVREFLQKYGTEAHRDVFGPNFWVEQVRLGHEGRIVMVTDVRFPNEAEAVRAAGGRIVEVVGPMGRVTADAHASEAPLPTELVDVVIQNVVRDDNFRSLDGSVDTLVRLVLKTVVPSC
jgi:hypothetical protein